MKKYRNFYLNTFIFLVVRFSIYKAVPLLQFFIVCTSVISITKTYLYNFDPLKPHFYTVNLGFTRVYIFFLFLLKNINFGY